LFDLVLIWVTGRSMKRICKFGFGAAIALATCCAAMAADLPASLPVKAPVPYVSPAYDWDGWYVGAHVGVVRGSSNWSAMPPGAGASALGGSFDLPFNFDFMAGTGSYVAGLQAGYNYVAPSRLMLGFELDASSRNSDVVVPFAVRGSQLAIDRPGDLRRGGDWLRDRPRPRRLCVRPFPALWHGRVGVEL
jgi:hypothetical protein